MASKPSQNWDKGEKSSLVSIGDHKLHVSVAGPDRKKNEPVPAVRRLVVPFARFLWYDRSGMGKSEGYPNPPKAITAEDIAHELDTLLKNINLAPPYIVRIGHTLVFKLSKLDSNEWEISGLREDHVLSKEEFEAIEKGHEDPRNQATQVAELEGFKTCFSTLAAKKQLDNHALGNHPISVIHGGWTARDFQLMYDAAIKKGNVTEKDREEYRDFIEEWEANSGSRMRGILELSSNPALRTYRDSTKSGHSVHLLEPEIIIEEIKRVYEYNTKVAA